jgi:hypothetical protein
MTGGIGVGNEFVLRSRQPILGTHSGKWLHAENVIETESRTRQDAGKRWPRNLDHVPTIQRRSMFVCPAVR